MHTVHRTCLYEAPRSLGHSMEVLVRVLSHWRTPHRVSYLPELSAFQLLYRLRLLLSAFVV